MNYILQMEHISKEYDSNVVLKDVSINVKPGEIYSLIGENGAGKSTLMNILFGMSVIQTTGGFHGSIKVDGEDVHFASPFDAMNAGIGMVHQEFMLIPGFTIAENIKIGRENTNPTLLSRLFGKSLEQLDRKKMREESTTALESIGMDINPDTYVSELPIGYKQFIEIAREIDKTNIKLLVFDEPTAVLTEDEADQLLGVMKTLANKGIAIIFITHRLDEIMQVADTLTVLRDGEVVATKLVAESNIVEIAELMVGRKIEKLVDVDEVSIDLKNAEIAVLVEDLMVDMPGENVKGISFDVKCGEIFGIGGLAGQGKIGIPNGISGMFPATGSVSIFGENIAIDKPGDALEKGVAFVSEDRRGVGLLLDESIERNITFDAITVHKKFLKKIGFFSTLDTSKIRGHSQSMIKLLDIRCTSSLQDVGSLSGGNQQKVCLANALTLDPRILVVSEPTRGIDIGAKKLIMEHLTMLRNEHNLTIIMVSSELSELRSYCDRIAIIADGVVSDILLPDASDAEFGLAMSALSTKEVQ